MLRFINIHAVRSAARVWQVDFLDNRVGSIRGIDLKELTCTSRRQDEGIGIIGIRQYRRGDKEALQALVVDIMPHIMAIERNVVVLGVKQVILDIFTWQER